MEDNIKSESYEAFRDQQHAEQVASAVKDLRNTEIKKFEKTTQVEILREQLKQAKRELSVIEAAQDRFFQHRDYKQFEKDINAKPERVL